MDTMARRDALAQLLRRRGHVTVDQVAGHLGVSRRTVLRDIAHLRDRGYSIAGEGGRGGGVAMDPKTVLTSAQLTADEVVALILSVAMLRATPWIPFSGQAERALAKVEGTLPPPRVRDLRRLLDRVLVGEPDRRESEEPPGSVDSALLTEFQHAFTQRVVLEFGYEDRNGRRSSRAVEPHAVLVRVPFWYVIAWDRDKGDVRLFRMDRIRSPRAMDGQEFPRRPLAFVVGVCPDAKPLRRGGDRSWSSAVG